MPRYVYKLGTHKISVLERQEGGSGERTYKTVPILSRALKRTGDLLTLDRATDEEIRTVREIQRGQGDSDQVIYYKLGSWRADRVILVYQVQEQGRTKLRRVQVPIPSWAPNYKVAPTLFTKAASAGLQLVGIYRHGFLIPAPSQGAGSEGGGEGGGGGQ